MTRDARNYALWADLLPPLLAIQQASYERVMRVGRMRQCGFLLKEVARREGISVERARQLSLKAARFMKHDKPPPVVSFFGETRELQALAAPIKARAANAW